MILILFFGCAENDDRLYWVDYIDGNDRDLLFLAESTNIKYIEKDSLKFYLTNEELAFNNSKFKVFQTIYQSDTFVAKVLFNSKQNSPGRNYSFEVRTYTNNHRLIDKFEFASWKKQEKLFCSGTIFNDLKITKICESKSDPVYYQITNSGSIVQLNNKTIEEETQKNNFELIYSIDGISLDKLERQPVFRIKDSIFTFAYEQIWNLDSEFFEPIEPLIIKRGIFRESSKDSIIQIINLAAKGEVVKINDEYSFWKTHNLIVSNGDTKIKFEIDYSVESDIHEILRIFNSYITENRDKLELF